MLSPAQTLAMNLGCTVGDNTAVLPDKKLFEEAFFLELMLAQLDVTPDRLFVNYDDIRGSLSVCVDSDDKKLQLGVGLFSHKLTQSEFASGWMNSCDELQRTSGNEIQKRLEKSGVWTHQEALILVYTEYALFGR